MTDSNMCYGCGACCAVCPVNALTLKSDVYGSYRPLVDKDKCISCGKCTDICPYNEGCAAQEKIVKQEYYSVYSSEEVCMKSASGGAFRSIAEYIIKRGGIVYGAAYDLVFHNVKHSRAETMDELEAICGSKYTQSFIATDIYTSVKNELESGKKVLYSGTPCQIAGLLNFLGKEYEHLYTSDIVCHGVSPAGYWKKYLNELGNTENITKVCFRAKEKQSNALEGYRLSIEYNDGSITELPTEKCFYYMAYFSGMSISSICTSCKYASSVRNGDLTLGDYIPESGHHQLNPKGNSLVIVSTDKGRRLFESVRHSDKRLTVTKISKREAVISNHSLYKPTPEPAGALGFRKDINDMPFEKAVKRNIGSKYDVLLFSPFYSGTPEDVFRTLAVYSVLKELGLTAALTELPLEMKSSENSIHYEKNDIQRLVYQHCPVFPPINDLRYIVRFTRSARMFLLAGEPLWEYTDADKWHLFGFAGDNIPRIALGVTLSERLEKCSNDLREDFYDCLYLFDSIFVSEDDIAEELSDILEMKIEFLPELLLLRDADFYYSFIKKKPTEKTDILHISKEDVSADLRKAIADIFSSETVVTDSYFAVVLSILSEKNIFVSENAPSYVHKFMTRYGLSERILKDKCIPDIDKGDIMYASDVIKSERSVLLSKIAKCIAECLEK